MLRLWNRSGHLRLDGRSRRGMGNGGIRHRSDILLFNSAYCPAAPVKSSYRLIVCIGTVENLEIAVSVITVVERE